jgi:pyrroloquinoline quinone biosynthesis protein B
VKARSQSSICVSGDGRDWVLINASPDIRYQLATYEPLQPCRRPRDTGVVGIVLVDSQIDHTTGLLLMRESDQPLNVYCSASVHQDLSSGFPIFPMLQHYCGVNWHELEIKDGSGDCDFKVPDAAGLIFTAVPLSSKAPPYSPHRNAAHPGDNIGLLIRDESSGRSAFYAPGLGAIEPHLLQYFEQADCLLVDGTFWGEDDMARAGVGRKSASEMGHLPQSGSGGMIAVLQSYRQARRILSHITNTNPILDQSSAERATLDMAGI